MFDATFFTKSDLIVGARYDRSHAKAFDERASNQTASGISSIPPPVWCGLNRS